MGEKPKRRNRNDWKPDGKRRVNGTWRKSILSQYNGNCAEVASDGGLVFVRDTQDRDGTVLAFSAGTWREFTARLR
jgi:hypothetical protein